MSERTLQLYHRLPSRVRSVAASMRGLYLRSWRYGPETERLVAEAHEREKWNAERWKSWQQERLAYVLHRAATRVPYYRDQWNARRRQGDRASWDYLENWPILGKEPLRRNSRAFVADDCSVKKMFHDHTSGTTGKSLDLWWSRETVRAWYALFEARCRGWFNVSRHDRWGMIGGQLITPVRQSSPPFWVWNAGLNQLYLSSYHLAPDLIPSYLDALMKHRITYLLGYPSSLYALALEALRQKRRDLKMEIVITNAEPVYDYQREAIARAFQCSVCETYGMAEIVAGASECPHGRLHLWPEVGFVEVLDGGRAADKGSSGDLVCTGLMNTDMPLIRYQVGDRGEEAQTLESVCVCGRSLPHIAKVEGRADDTLYTIEGRRIGRLDPVFKANLPVHEAQIIQETLGRIRVRYVPAGDFTAENKHSIVERLQSRLGDMNVILERVDEVPREANGKFRAVICNLSPQEREYLEGLGS